ncbi:MAG: dihydrodipicolinate synthase family protein, partial [Acidobacteriota bacterium]
TTDDWHLTHRTTDHWPLTATDNLLVSGAGGYNAPSVDATTGATHEPSRARFSLRLIMSINLNGIIAALPTPFSETGEVAPDKLTSNLASWNQTGLLGYLILGSTGEFPHLTTEERLTVIETVRDSTPQEKLLLVGTGELSTRATIEMTRQAASRGADAAVVVTPFYYKRLLDEEQLEAHYLRVADNATIPILIYLIPQFSGVYLRPETIARLSEHPNIIGLKDSSGDLSSLEDLFGLVNTDEFSILMGAPQLLKQSLAAGAAGGVLAVGCVAPRTCVTLEQMCRSDADGRTEALQDRLSRLSRRTTANGIGYVKAALDLVGLYGYLPRSPLPAPTSEQREDIAAAIAESGFFEQSGDEGTWTELIELGDLEYAD